MAAPRTHPRPHRVKLDVNGTADGWLERAAAVGVTEIPKFRVAGFYISELKNGSEGRCLRIMQGGIRAPIEDFRKAIQVLVRVETHLEAPPVHGPFPGRPIGHWLQVKSTTW